MNYIPNLICFLELCAIIVCIIQIHIKKVANEYSKGTKKLFA